MVARGEGRVLRSYSFLSRRGEAECPSFVLWHGGVFALILCLSSRPPSRSPMSCEPDTVASCRACSPRLIVLLISSGVAFIPVSPFRLVARLGERGGFGFSFYPDGERRGCGSRPAVPGPVLACLDAVGAMR